MCFLDTSDGLYSEDSVRIPAAVSTATGRAGTDVVLLPQVDAYVQTALAMTRTGTWNFAKIAQAGGCGATCCAGQREVGRNTLLTMYLSRNGATTGSRFEEKEEVADAHWQDTLQHDRKYDVNQERSSRKEGRMSRLSN